MIVVMLVRVITVLFVTSWWRQWWWWWCWRLWLSLRQAGCMSAEIRTKDIWLYDYMYIDIYWRLWMSLRQAACMSAEICMKEGSAADLNCIATGCQFNVWQSSWSSSSSWLSSTSSLSSSSLYDRIPLPLPLPLPLPMIMLARMWCSHIDGSCQSKSKNGNIRKAAIDSWRGPAQDVTSVDLIFNCAHNKYMCDPMPHAKL